MTILTLSTQRDLLLSSRIISFITNALSLGFLVSFPVAQTFETALCHSNLWQSLSSETSRWNMQAIGTPTLSKFYHEFSLDQLIIRDMTTDSTRRSFPKCFNLNDLFSQKMGASISRHNFNHIYGKLFFTHSIAWITKLQLSLLRCLSLSSRIISFISIVLPSSSLFSFQIAQMFEILFVV